MGWTQVPLMCALEIPCRQPAALHPGAAALEHRLPQNQIQHVYLGAAASLRPDLIQK
jgi:chorismate mutase